MTEQPLSASALHVLSVHALDHHSNLVAAPVGMHAGQVGAGLIVWGWR